MATRREWGQAYLAQARSDLAAARAIGSQEPAVFAMLLQMTFEKTAKGILLLGGMIDVGKATSTHRVAPILVGHLKRNRQLLVVLGASGQYGYERELALVRELESLNPAVVKASGKVDQQLEYPWEDAQSGDVHWPARHLTFASRLADPQSTEGPHLQRFAHALIAHAEALVG